MPLRCNRTFLFPSLNFFSQSTPHIQCATLVVYVGKYRSGLEVNGKYPSDAVVKNALGYTSNPLYASELHCIILHRCYLAFKISTVYLEDYTTFAYGDQPFMSHWLLYVSAPLLFKNSTFCSQSYLMCIVRTSEQIAIISVHSNICLVFTTHIALY